jgi:hypothetical protein
LACEPPSLAACLAVVPTDVHALPKAVPAAPPSCWASSLQDFTAASMLCLASLTPEVVDRRFQDAYK